MHWRERVVRRSNPCESVRFTRETGLLSRSDRLKGEAADLGPCGRHQLALGRIGKAAVDLVELHLHEVGPLVASLPERPALLEGEARAVGWAAARRKKCG